MATSYSINTRKLVDDLGGVSSLYEKLRARFPEMRLNSAKTIEKWRERKRITLENFMRCKTIAGDAGKKISLDDYVITKE